MRHRPARLFGGFGLLAPLTLLAGCNATYTLDARNDSRTAVDLRIERDVVAADDEVLVYRRLAPGEWVELGDFTVPGLDPVTARVGLPGDSGLPSQKLRLDSGTSTIIIDDGGDSAWTSVTARVEHP